MFLCLLPRSFMCFPGEGSPRRFLPLYFLLFFAIWKCIGLYISITPLVTVLLWLSRHNSPLDDYFLHPETISGLSIRTFTRYVCVSISTCSRTCKYYPIICVPSTITIEVWFDYFKMESLHPYNFPVFQFPTCGQWVAWPVAKAAQSRLLLLLHYFTASEILSSLLLSSLTCN